LDLTNYIGKNGLITKPYTTPTDTDLLTEMNNFGLKVSHLDISGQLVRVMVSASSGVRPDKSNEKSGWYVIHQVGDHIFANFGNWRTGQEQKWSSTKNSNLTQREREDLTKKIQEAQKKAEIEQKKRQNEVAVDCESRFSSYAKVEDHRYLTIKNIQNYGLKSKSESLVVPIFNILGEIRSLQYINQKGDKRFVSAGEVKGNMFLIGTDFDSLPKLENLIVVEGYATGSTVYEATNTPVACVFSANFGYEAVKNLRTKTDCKITLAFDNDKTGLGQKKAQEISSSFYNCSVRIPSISGDFNDLARDQGLEKVKLELLDLGFGLRKYSIKNFQEKPPERVWLVDKMVESSKPSLLASIGGVGKSMLSLSLGLNIVGAGNGKWLNKNIVNHGNVVFLSAEDDQNEFHRRVDALDPKGKRHTAPYDLYAFTVPDFGKPVSFVKDDHNGLGLTTQAHEFMEELSSINNLALVVIDPVQSFVSAPITTSQEVAQLYCQFCSAISSQFGCATLSIHHMSKLALQGNEDSMTARSSIRGSSALVDGMRMAMAIWLTSEQDAENICAEQGLDYDRTRVVRAGIVKSNASEVDTNIMTLVRKKSVLEVYDKAGINWD
tara:strand:+ start:12211 stop:14034 length:1824 start_codon:yes stop_codon:yes gene_type:complete